MKLAIIHRIRKFLPSAFFEPQGEAGVQKLGHREYVGGMWDEIGTLQFDFLKSRGMEPQHYLLDIACGSLRLGVKAIPYLDRGHYLGIEKEPSLVKSGLEVELDTATREEKEPNIVVSDAFEFEKLNAKADFAIAQSLFSHFPSDLINLCFRNLHPALSEGGVFYATYFLTAEPRKNPDTPHDHGYFAFTREEMCAFGENNGYTANHIGDWNHPRDQVIVEYKKA